MKRFVFLYGTGTMPRSVKPVNIRLDSYDPPRADIVYLHLLSFKKELYMIELALITILHLNSVKILWLQC